LFYELPTIKKKVLELSFGKLSDRARQKRRAWPKVLWEQVKSSEDRLSEKLSIVNTGHEECKWVNFQLLNFTSHWNLGTESIPSSLFTIIQSLWSVGRFRLWL